MYTVAAAGANLWSTVDAFHFVWKKVSGDVSLTADYDVSFGCWAIPSPHRKAVLMFRQTLDARWGVCRCGTTWVRDDRTCSTGASAAQPRRISN